MVQTKINQRCKGQYNNLRVLVRGPPFNLQKRGWALEFFITCLCRTVLKVNYLFHAESTRNYLLKKNSPPWGLNGGPLTVWREKLSLHKHS